MRQDELISVIIPIYNDEKFLEQCVTSVLNQTYQNLDIILMDDGSTDQTPDICSAFASKDRRVRVFRKENGGVGSSRNAALAEVMGAYVLFIDHDDWIDPTHIEDLYRKLVETGADIAISNFSEFDNERGVFKIAVHAKDYYEDIMTPDQWFQQQYHSRFQISQCFTVPWGKLYKSHLFENILYPTLEKVEDDFTTWKIYLKAKALVYMNKATYVHRKLASSVTGTVDVTAIFPLRSIEERIAMLSLLGMDISNELRAYRWRLERHLAFYLETGNSDAYRNIKQKLDLLKTE
ncbi:glycosyltransferase family 2 protein [Streptococcus plurextorum]|uniref:glycosyltransferase family 2 protein n=1 Tax=Streptococcus plurextorum TaxID=456876 RepID=UPI00040F23BE|nr:glycosyltransferase family 2 protein [Streptococcus plurextorum]